MLPPSLNSSDFVPDVVPRDIQDQHGASRLVDETFHKVPLVLPVVGYLVVGINVDKRLDRCIADFLCNRIERLVMTWALL